MTRTVSEIADELLGLFDRTGDLRHAVVHTEAALLALAWYARTWHTTKALLLLHRDGFDPEAAPMRRSLIEHALALQWIGHSPDEAFDVHAANHQYEVKKFANKPGSESAVPPETLDALLALELNGGQEAHLGHTYDLATKYGPNGAYTGWWYETGGSHPSWRSAQPYRDGRMPQRPLDELMTVVWFACASAGMSMLLEGDPWAQTITRCDAELAQPAAEALAAERTRQAEHDSPE